MDKDGWHKNYPEATGLHSRDLQGLHLPAALLWSSLECHQEPIPGAGPGSCRVVCLLQQSSSPSRVHPQHYVFWWRHVAISLFYRAPRVQRHGPSRRGWQLWRSKGSHPSNNCSSKLDDTRPTQRPREATHSVESLRGGGQLCCSVQLSYLL